MPDCESNAVWGAWQQGFRWGIAIGCLFGLAGAAVGAIGMWCWMVTHG